MENNALFLESMTLHFMFWKHYLN